LPNRKEFLKKRVLIDISPLKLIKPVGEGEEILDNFQSFLKTIMSSLLFSLSLSDQIDDCLDLMSLDFQDKLNIFKQEILLFNKAFGIAEEENVPHERIGLL